MPSLRPSPSAVALRSQVTYLHLTAEGEVSLEPTRLQGLLPLPDVQELGYVAEQPSYGRLTLFGADALAADRDTRAALRRRIGIVFQDLRLLAHLGIRDNIALPLRIAGIPEDKIRDHVDELATWLGIASQLESSPQTLSAGERQRVAIARAIVSRPDLLIADEPTAGRDDETALSLLRAFERLHSLGTTVLIATDNIALARRLECRHLHLEEGWLTSLDTAAIQ